MIFATFERLTDGERVRPNLAFRSTITRSLLMILSLVLPHSRSMPAWAATPQGHVSGAFLQLDTSNVDYSAAEWKAELEAMHAIGMDTLVVQYVASDNRYFYPTSRAGVEPAKSDPLRHLLDAAEKLEIKIYLGLQMNNAFWIGTVDLDERLERNLAVIDELQSRYMGSSALAGWYLPEEIDDQMAGKPHQDALLEYFGRITHHAHERTALPTMISPYFGQKPDAAAYARWWDEVALPKIDVDIVALQDGVGTHRTSIEESREVFVALSPVMARHGVAFWANNECFDQTSGWPVNDDGWAARTTDQDVFTRQVRASAPFVEKTITFEFDHYMNPKGTPRARKLYEACRKEFDRRQRQSVGRDVVATETSDQE